MKTHEIRQSFLDFFKSKGHEVEASSSLVPHGDATLLFSNAGMNQFKDVFLGKEKRPYSRATTAQKCVRAGGKHNDLENVGYTARHHTFFEMLGNFSFGDYFKEEAIAFAWEYVTQVLKLPLDKLYITVYKDDDEAYDIWTKKQGVDPKRIFRLGDKDNFWQMGDTGPCGPCTELFIDRGPSYCKQDNGKCIEEDHDCDRYIEFWNLVFMQYDRDDKGTLHPLPKPSVDTGAGLERLAAILQDVESNYEIDLFQEIIQFLAEKAGTKYDLKSPTKTNFRVIADHARSVAFLIGDGVIPSNEGRGYVLRRIIRRAVRYGRDIGFKEPFLHDVCGFVINQMKSVYPDLSDKLSFVQKAVFSEEEQFLRTLDKGLSLLGEEIAKLKKGGQISGEVAFKLYDTFGFPLDLTLLIAREKGIGVDEKGFEICMGKQKEQSRKNWKGSGEAGVADIYHEMAEKLKSDGSANQDFEGYSATRGRGTVKFLLKKEEKRLVPIESVTAEAGGKPVDVEIVFDRTPFYGEGGGQVGDQGVVEGPGVRAKILDAQKPVDQIIVLKGKLEQGTIKVGDSYDQLVDNTRRNLVMRNHTATHLMHGALRKVLGDHVKQAGSLVNEDLLRFDFSHFNAMSKQEIQKVEDLVNAEIWASYPVESLVTTKDEAVAAGAIAFFGEKYGDTVRVIKAGSYSVELCGGTHVGNTGDIQLFKIVSEGAIAAGVRRVVAYTSKAAYEYLNDRFDETVEVREKLKAGNADETYQKLDKLMASEKELRRKLDGLKAQEMASQIDSLISGAQKFEGGQLISVICESDPKGVKYLRDMSDLIRNKAPNSVVILGMKNEDDHKAFILTAVGKEVSATISASDMIKTLAPMIDGRGGGKPDLAQAGGTKVSGLDQAVSEAQKIAVGILS